TGAEDAVHHDRIVLDQAVVEEHGAFHGCARADPAIPAEHVRRTWLRTRRDLAPVADRRRTVQRRRNPDLDPFPDQQSSVAETVAGDGFDPALEDVPIRLQEAVGRPDVDPVAVEPDPVQTVADELRKDLALDRDRPLRGDPLEYGA